MGLIDIENIDYVKLEDSLHCLEHHKGDEVECVICAPTVEAIPKDQYETRLNANTTEKFKEFRDKLSKWMFHNSESVCGNSMIDIDYLEGHMDELLYELGIYEVDNGSDKRRKDTESLLL